MKDKPTLKSFPIEKGNYMNRFNASYFKRKLMKAAYIHLTWIDPSKNEHEFLAQWDGTKVEVKKIGSKEQMDFPLTAKELDQSSIDKLGFTHVIFAMNSPMQAVLYRNQDFAEKLDVGTIGLMVRRERMAATALAQTQASNLKKAALTMGVMGMILVLFIVGMSFLKGGGG